MSTAPNNTSTQAKDFEAVRVSLASPQQMERWSHGEVTKPETINYRTQKPEKDGLFDERIFGPTKDWECYCGKYKKIRYKGIVCDKCGVEVTRSAVRRERLGHIKLAAPVVHIWYLRGTFSRLGLLLGMSIKYLEKVVYFANFVITAVNDEKRVAMQEQLKGEFEKATADGLEAHQKAVQEVTESRTAAIATASGKEKKVLEAELSSELERLAAEQAEETEVLQSGYTLALDEIAALEPLQIITEAKYREFKQKYAGVFEAGVGAEAILHIIENLDLNQLAVDLESEARETTGQRRRKALKRLNLVEGFRKAEINPAWMILTSLPVIPPDLRPMVQLDGGRFAASDLNDLYRRVINRNNRLKKLMKLRAPEVIQRNEKRMLQEAVDALIDNSARRGRAVSSIGNKRRLKSLSDMLKGKQGRFRQNLLGKRVDYSGRSVIVGGANLKLDECGIPKRMALELFKPFVIGKLLAGGFSHNVKSASKMIDRGLQGVSEPAVWDMLDEVIKKHYVLLNRAPTLHRLGIQAFRPILIEGKAIKIHPLVCTAFNADFDGDQMAVHVPLSLKAQEEARLLMSAKHNLLKPAAGEPVVAPTLEIVLGCFYLTSLRHDVPGEGKVYASIPDAILAYQNDNVHYQAKVRVRVPDEGIIETSVGRVLFNNVLPDGMAFINKATDKKILHKIVSDVYEQFGSEITATVVDELKSLGFEYATNSGITISSSDLTIPKEKDQIIADTRVETNAIGNQYDNGLITEHERYTKVLDQWRAAGKKIEKAMLSAQDPQNPVYQTVISGARGNISQLNQMAGMKGLVVNPSGRIIELPIISNYKEGFKALEYFISTHGTRKGLTDKGLRTPDAGYLTRRLVDVSQDTVITVADCGTKAGLTFTAADADERGDSMYDHIYGRTLLKDVKGADGKVVAKKDDLLDQHVTKRIIDAGSPEAVVRSILNCEATVGGCQKCYGMDLALGKLVHIGEAVGVIAAQSIGEPGTQLTMRTFHTGGVAAEDITQGLPRVEELFEARPPKGQAILTDIAGTVRITEKDKLKVLTLTADQVKDEEPEVREYTLPPFTKIRIKDKEHVAEGTQLTDGSLNLHELMSLKGREETWRYIISEVQQIYAAQAQHISDKHIEIVVKEMLSKVRVIDSGETNLIPSEVLSEEVVKAANDALGQSKPGKEKATYESLVLGITKASLLTDSFLSAASFQETTKILIDAALTGQTDHLRGLKENVIIGKLIPAGTGMDEDYLYSKVPKEIAVLDAPAPQAVSSIDEGVAPVTRQETPA